MAAKQADSTYRLKISLRTVKPLVWRRVEVPGGLSLASVSEILLDAMGWGGGHLHDFEIDGVEYETPDEDEDWGRPMEDDRRYRLDAVVTEPGARFRFGYDFGDGWQHDVVVEAIEPRITGVVYPRVTAGKRNCPPDDCGGPSGYQRFLATISDPTHPDHEGMLDWAGGSFDPAAFSIAETNDVLAERFGSLRPLPRSSRRPPAARPARTTRRADPGPEALTIAADGTVRLPRSILRAMGLPAGGSAFAIVVNGTVVLMRDPRIKS